MTPENNIQTGEKVLQDLFGEKDIEFAFKAAHLVSGAKNRVPGFTEAVALVKKIADEKDKNSSSRKSPEQRIIYHIERMSHDDHRDYLTEILNPSQT